MHGRVGVAEVADIQNPQVLGIAAHIVGIDAGQEPQGVTIRLHDGRSATGRVGPPLGSPENPFSSKQLEMKFMDCARNAVRPLSEDALRAAADMILHLEDVGNISELLRHFV